MTAPAGVKDLPHSRRRERADCAACDAEASEKPGVVCRQQLGNPAGVARADELRGRVKRFAIRALTFVKTLPHDPATLAVSRQLARSAPGVSANYHSAGRSRSSAEFRARLGVVLDEADETVGWLEILKESGSAAGAELEWLVQENRELRAIFVQALKTARRNAHRAAGKGGGRSR